MKICKQYDKDGDIILYNGNCLDILKQIPDESIDIIITSPPYCMKKAYENSTDDINTFREVHKTIFPELYRILKPYGSICWQVGYHVNDTQTYPLDYIVYDIFTNNSSKLKYPLILRNRIIWTFGHGLNSTKRFSGRHETILWFTKGDKYTFNLDDVRVPQKYPGKRSYKGPNKGKISGNPLGKNPSDIWDIPNVKAQHIEKTSHPCQYPVALPRRLIKALTKKGDMVLDPFMGSGTTGVAAIMEDRKFIGAEIVPEYYEISNQRIKDAINGDAKIRPDVPAMEPNTNSAVARIPDEWRSLNETKKEEKSINRGEETRVREEKAS